MKVKDIKVKNIKNLYEEIIERTNCNDPIGTYASFYNYLYNVFTLRESYGLTDTMKDKKHLKEDSVFGALKYLYEAYKHKKNEESDLLLKLNLFVYAKKYPFSYPYTYGRAFVRYEKLHQDVIELQKDNDHQKRFKELYERYLQDKLLETILKEINDEVLKEDNNG